MGRHTDRSCQRYPLPKDVNSDRKPISPNNVLRRWVFPACAKLNLPNATLADVPTNLRVLGARQRRAGQGRRAAESRLTPQPCSKSFRLPTDSPSASSTNVNLRASCYSVWHSPRMRRSVHTRSTRSERYPLATVAAYGPDSRVATKLAVSVLQRANERDPIATRTWTTETGDVRQDPIIAAELTHFLREHGVKNTVSPDRIIGCPHQEGIDYPMGRSCPACPFWAGIDRFTHEPLLVPAPTMSPTEILAQLSRDRSTQPQEALRSAEGHRPALVEPLLAALERGIANPGDVSAEDANLFSYALYLLAKWREPRAFPYVIRWLSLPDEEPFALGGDIVTQDGARILAAVCDGDLAPIKTLILNRDADEYGRANGVSALALLVAWAEVPREPIVEYFLWLAREGLEREPGQVWDSLAADSADIEASAVFPELRRAYRDGLVDPQFMRVEELDEAEAAMPGTLLDAVRDRQPPIDDVALATSWWSAFAEDRKNDHVDDELIGEDGEVVERQEPYRAPAKVGRNESCPCGSGKKYKKCCGR